MITYPAAKAAPVIIENHSFCFTGRAKVKRSRLAEIVFGMGGTVDNRVTRKTDYLVVGGRGNVRWKYGEYGNKTARAREIQRKGGKAEVITEERFWEASKLTNDRKIVIVNI